MHLPNHKNVSAFLCLCALDIKDDKEKSRRMDDVMKAKGEVDAEHVLKTSNRTFVSDKAEKSHP